MSRPLSKLAYSSPEEKADFHQEFSQLDPARYRTGERPGHLLTIYRRLVAEMTPFAQLLHESKAPGNRTPLLQAHLATWINGETPDNPLFDALLYLDARTLGASTLQALTQLPAFLCSPNELGILRAAPLAALEQLAEFMTTTFPAFEKPACRRRHSSIWSIRELRQSGQWYSVATIEVNVHTRSVVQFFGRHNATPAAELRTRLQRWAEREGLAVMG